MEVKAVVRDTGITPRKARFLLDMVRGKSVAEALIMLEFTPSPSAKTVAKVIKSAAADAENVFQMPIEDLTVVKIFADEARTMKRFRSRSRGRVSPILKRSSHITVIVAGQES
ncbi:MAG: 50S ribosomal protein L22 [Chloroflexi bacterium RBG_16_51_9]|nr:MAG: 50S ribosomal protein L22 [Chloroflexi bacterium RBG_16_51_9]